MAHILLVEDNAPYAADVAEFLEEIGYGTTISGSACQMWEALAAQPSDVVILDLGLPDEDGINIVPRLRQLYPDTGIVVLTARVTTDNRILGLRVGADAYLPKPIQFRELAAHIEAVGRRLRPRTSHASPAAWRLCGQRRQLEWENKRTIRLTAKEFAFLHTLAINARPVQRDALLISLGEKNALDASRKLDMLVYRLRKKARLELGSDLPVVSTYGEGYSLAAAFELA